jgi:DNA-binding PadR family transcriptional regulator
MGSKKHALSGDQRKLLPLTPAVFYLLFALAGGEKHGYAIMQQAAALSNGQFRMGPGTLYTTIQRLVDLQLIEEIFSADEPDTRRRYYRLTGAGEALLEAELARMRSVLDTAQKLKLAPAGRIPRT